MYRNAIGGLCWGTLLLGALLWQCVPATAYEPGDEVAVINTELGLRVGDDEIHDTALGEVFTVREVGQASLLVGDGDVRGELIAEDVLPLEEALDHFNNLLAEQEAADHHAALGRIYVHQSDYEAALEHYNAAVDFDLQNPERYADRGQFQLDSGDFEAALRDFERALRLGGETAAVYLGKAEAQRYSYVVEEAQVLESYASALELEDTNPEIYCSRGWFHQEQGEPQLAAADFEQALECDPDSILAIYDVAWVAATSPVDELRDGERALELAQRVIEMVDEPLAYDYELLAAAYAETGDFDQAIEAIQQAIEIDSQSEFPYDEFNVQLQLYQRERPYRDPLPGIVNPEYDDYEEEYREFRQLQDEPLPEEPE